MRSGARFVLASTSEVYGDPEVHPQVESYVGHVNPIGPRSVYDEAKRYAEALTMAYTRSRHTEVTIARIVNTYGPRMRIDDGRMVPTFIAQAMAREPCTITGLASLPAVEDDPQRRCPDISRAVERLDWRPLMQLEEGLKQTIDWFVERHSVGG